MSDAHFGWTPNFDHIEAYANAPEQKRALSDSSKLTAEGKDTFLWLPLLEVKPSWKRGAQGIGDCYAKGTIVFGERTKPIEDVRVGDMVWSGTGKLTRVISTQVKVSMRPMVRLTPWGGVPLEVTEDHKILVYRMRRVAGKRVTKNYYERCQKRQADYKASSKWQLGRTNAVVECYENRQPEWVRAGDISDTDCLLTPLNFTKPKLPASPKDILGTAAGRYLIGNFVGDGCVHTNQRTIQWSCSSESFANRLAKILDRSGFTAKVKKHGDANCWDVLCHSKELGSWLIDNFYDEHKSKVFPAWSVGDAHFIAGLRAADGFSRGHISYLDSTSASVAYGAFASLLQLGYQPTISNSGERTGGGVFANAKPIFRVIWRKNKEPHRIWKDDSFLCRPIRKIERIEGPTVVYDIGVAEDSHSFIANGIIGANCVSWGAELAVTMLMAIQHKAGTSTFIEEAATEAIYGGGRVEANGGRLGGWSDGSWGSAAASWLNKWGVLLRQDYSKDTGVAEHDLRVYSSRKAKDWGNYGCGGKNDDGRADGLLDKVARQFPVKAVTKIRDTDHAAGLLESGYPITIASGAGFGSMARDSDGVVRRRGSWAHQMMIGGVRYKDGKPQFRIFQSWGSSCSGPDPGVNSPAVSACSWWATTSDAQSIFNEGDSWAFADIVGFPARNFDWLKQSFFA